MPRERYQPARVCESVAKRNFPAQRPNGLPAPKRGVLSLWSVFKKLEFGFARCDHFFGPKYFWNSFGSGGGSSFWIGIR
jgi:hypothetical protein